MKKKLFVTLTGTILTASLLIGCSASGSAPKKISAAHKSKTADSQQTFTVGESATPNKNSRN